MIKIFLIVIVIVILLSNSNVAEGFTEINNIKSAIKLRFGSDTNFISTLGETAGKLTNGTLTDNDRIYIKADGDDSLQATGKGNNPYITLGKTDTWNNQALYMQNVNAHTTDPIFRIATHNGWHMSDMSKKDGMRFQRKDGKWIQLDASDGNNYIRGDTTFDNNTTISGNLTINGIFNSLPPGSIVMWNGTTVPVGWALCNGEKGRPNLVNRFVVGTGGEYTVGKWGGEREVKLGINQMPKHSHTVTQFRDCRNMRASGTGGCWLAGPPGGATLSQEGGDQPHENRPPFYALAFIIKLPPGETTTTTNINNSSTGIPYGPPPPPVMRTVCTGFGRGRRCVQVPR